MCVRVTKLCVKELRVKEVYVCVRDLRVIKLCGVVCGKIVCERAVHDRCV